MAKWIYTCKSGKELRNLIDRAGTWEMSIRVLEQLKECYKEILDNYPWEDEYDECEVASAASCLEGDDIVIRNWMDGIEDIEDYGFDTDEDLVDARLMEFYALCDEYRIWVEV